MEAEFRLSLQDLNESQHCHCKNSRFRQAIRRFVIPVLAVAMLVAGGFLLLVKAPPDSLLSLGLLGTVPITRLILLLPQLLALGGAWSLTTPGGLLSRALASQAFNTSKEFQTVHQILIDSSGFVWLHKKSNKRRSWQSFRGFRETQNLYLLYNRSIRDAEILPKRAFSPEHLVSLRQTLSQNLSEL